MKKKKKNKGVIDEFIIILVIELGSFGGWINGEDDEYNLFIYLFRLEMKQNRERLLMFG